jgi:GNAT superfamily N-acetyltransferase
MNIIRAEYADLQRILDIQKAAYVSEATIYNDFSIPPLQQTLEGLQDEFKTSTVLKVTMGSDIVGSVRLQLKGSIVLLGRLIVDPPHQGKGIGTALLEAANSIFPKAKCIELFTGSLSVRNIRFYERHGYIKTREESMSENVRLVYMRKPLIVPE